jgi:hypothetical protein
LGKEFSANVLNEKINQQKPNTNEPNPPGQDKSQPFEDNTSSMENLTGLLGLENRGENYEEEAFIRRTKRKKKRKRKY